MTWRMYFVRPDGEYFNDYETYEEAYEGKRWAEAANKVFVIAIRSTLTEAIWYRHYYRGGNETWEKGNMAEFKRQHKTVNFDDFKWRPYQ